VFSAEQDTRQLLVAGASGGCAIELDVTIADGEAAPPRTIRVIRLVSDKAGSDMARASAPPGLPPNAIVYNVFSKEDLQPVCPCPWCWSVLLHVVLFLDPSVQPILLFPFS